MKKFKESIMISLFSPGSKTIFNNKYIVAQSFFDEIGFLINVITVVKVIRFECHMKNNNNPTLF